MMSPPVVPNTRSVRPLPSMSSASIVEMTIPDRKESVLTLLAGENVPFDVLIDVVDAIAGPNHNIQIGVVSKLPKNLPISIFLTSDCEYAEVSAFTIGLMFRLLNIPL